MKDKVNHHLLNDLEGVGTGLFASNVSVDDTSPRTLSFLSHNYQKSVIVRKSEPFIYAIESFLNSK